MHSTPPLPLAPADALERARRVGAILAAVAALIARRFLREPTLLPLIVPLWGWLGRTARRFERALTRLPTGVPTGVPTGRVALLRDASAPAAPVVVRAPRVRFPGRQGWLVRVLGYEAVAYKLQLEHVLAEPGLQDLLAALPAAARLLRPVCRILGIVTEAAAKTVAATRGATKPKRARVPARVRGPHQRRDVWDWSPGPIRPPWPAKSTG